MNSSNTFFNRMFPNASQKTEIRLGKICLLLSLLAVPSLLGCLIVIMGLTDSGSAEPFQIFSFRAVVACGILALILLWLLFSSRNILLLIRLLKERREAFNLQHPKGKQAPDTEAEAALKESEERFRLVVENAPLGIITLDTTGKIIDINQKIVEITGSPSAEQTLKINMLTFPPLVKAGIADDFAKCLSTGASGVHEKAYISKWGKRVYIRYYLSPLYDADHHISSALAIMEDYTDHKEAERQLQSLHEQTKADAESRAVLLEEVNHRVKNNLAGIIGMLYATRKFINTIESREDYLATLENLIHRIEGMAAVHEILSEADWSPIPLSELVNRIIRISLLALPPDKQVETDIIADNNIMVSPKQASNLGMIINELITNTIKHAFDKRSSIKITVRVTWDGDEVRFQFHNDGPEFPEEVLSLKSFNTGIYLTETLVSNGLGGTLALRNDDGAMTDIRFKP
jgi:PAS domain S-box-containing protein